ncbi:uncharacterized protein N7458_008237 [Penicillium daleae]|uniref:Uncharacterized protein n=1 Tax=Penicillium daleae TaxID=63821 RepID=A0AAD6C4F3_9EURO|nr:uncharacterized protein N7458_008237 [Penicillium daleae]KAJ5444365.1 hypothetical protein N7458_008237 [Penicillium daleae]
MTSKPALNTLTRLSSQIHISANPPPRNLAESKQIFAALQGFGEIISFRNLKYDIHNNTDRERPLLAMFDSSDAAERAIAASPLTITLPEPTAPVFTKNPFASTSTSSSSDPSPSPSPSDSPSTTSSSSSSNPTTITCTLSPSRHNYERATRRNPFYNMFHIDKKSAIYADMRSEETATPLAELADVLQRTKGVTFASQRFGTRVHAQRIGADSLTRIWKMGVRERRRVELEGKGNGKGKEQVEGDGKDLLGDDRGRGRGRS